MDKVNKIFLGIIIDTALKIPPNTGVTFRLYFLSRKLSEIGVNVKIFLCNRIIKKDSDTKSLFESSSVEYHVMSENAFYDPKKLLNLISKQKINILQFEDAVSVLRYKNIAEELKIPILLEMHDVESTLKELLGYCLNEIKKTKKITLKSCQVADRIVCMTPRDIKELIEMGAEKSKIDIVPNPLDSDFFPFLGPNTKSPNILFVGNMFYWPNKKAATFIAQKIAPKVIKNLKGATFYFVGMVPKDLKEEFQRKNIIFTGSVNDLNSFLQKSSIALCPILEGSGMKVKILNYGAAGIPTITTTLGASGYENIKSLVIEDDLNKYADIIIKMFLNKEEMSDRGKKLRKEIESKYDVNRLAKKMKIVYEKIAYVANSKNGSLKRLDLAKPLWLQEKRVSPIKNNNYYIIKNGKVIYKEKIT